MAENVHARGTFRKCEITKAKKQDRKVESSKFYLPINLPGFK